MNEPSTPDRRLEILLVEDDLAHAKLIRRSFRNYSKPFRFAHVVTLSAAEEKLAANEFDILIVDIQLPDGHGTRLIEAERVREKIPIIVLTSHGDEDAAIQATKAGALDFVVKSDSALAYLPCIVDRSLREWNLRQERASALAALEASERRYRELVNDVEAIVWEARLPCWTFTFVSKSAERILGYPVEQWLNEKDFWVNHIHPDDRAAAIECCQNSTSEGRDHQFDYRAIAADGRAVWLRDVVHVVKNEHGQPYKLRGVMINVDRQRNAEQALRQSERSLAQAQRIAKVGNWHHDLTTGVLTGSEEMYRIVGITPEEFDNRLESFVERFVYEQDRQRLLDAYKRTLQTRQSQSLEFRMVRADGHVLHVLAEAEVEVLDDRPIRMIGTVQDITKRKEAEEAVHESESRFRQLADNINEVFWLYSWPQRELLYVSPAFEDIFRQTREALFEDPTLWFAAIVPQDRGGVIEHFEQQAAEHGYDLEYQIDAKQQMKWIHERAFPIKNENGEVYRIGGIAEDITVRKEAELRERRHRDELAHVARLSTLGEMITGLAHEINQPLYAISNFATAACNMLAHKEPIEVEEVRDWNQRIAHQARRAGEIVNRLGRFARKAVPKRSTIDLNQLACEAIDFVSFDARRRNISLHFAAQVRPTQVIVDRVLIQQVIVNLLTNAFDSIDAAGHGSGRVSLSTYVTEKGAQLVVEDNGVGLDEEEEQIFEAFFTTKENGIGMGLAICRSIVEAHSGRLWIDKRAKGAAFCVDLPTPQERDVYLR